MSHDTAASDPPFDDALRRRFESSWRSGRPEPIEACLPPAHDSRFAHTLEALVHIELEWSWRRFSQPQAGAMAVSAARPPAIEEYVERFPSLATAGALLELCRREFAVRARYGDGPSVDEYRRRFPEIVKPGDELSPPSLRVEFATPRLLGGETLGLASAPPAPAAVAGQLGEYDLIEEIARGGMGIVYKARQRRLNRLVAVKMMTAGDLADGDEVRRFLAEAQAAANLNHPNIVAIHEVGEHGGRHFFSMDLVDGRSLSRGTRGAGTGLPPRDAARYVRDIAEALEFAHQHGVLHRDVKPSNVLIDREGRVRVTDFGLAKQLQGDSNLTRSGQIVGTPSYMPPEQADSRVGPVGPASDVYSLGAVLFELLTGQPPFQAESAMETIVQVLNDDPTRPRKLRPDAPLDLETVCLKCLAKRPRERYQSAREVAEEMQRFLDGRPVQARPLGPASRAWRWLRRKPVVAALAVSVALVAALGVATFVYVARANRQEKLYALLLPLNDALERPGLGAAYQQELDKLLDAIERLDPNKATEARRQAYGADSDDAPLAGYPRFLAGLIEAPSIDERRLSELADAVERLEARNASAAQRLATMLQKRKSPWHVEIDLTSPFVDWERSLHEPAGMTIDPQGRLRRDEASALRERAAFAVASTGEREWQVEFGPDWQAATRVGLGFGLDPERADEAPEYELILTLDRGDGEEPLTFLQGREQSLAARIELLHAGAAVQSVRRPLASIPAGSLSMSLVRRGARLLWSVGAQPPVSFDEVFARPAAERGRLFVHWPAAVSISHVRARRPATPAPPGPLAAADALYLEGQHAAALAVFEREAATASDASLQREAQFKAAICLLALGRSDDARGLLEQAAAAEQSLSPSERRWLAPALARLWSIHFESKRTSDADATFAALQQHFSPQELAVLLPAEVRDAVVRSYEIELGTYGYFATLDLTSRLDRLKRAATVLEQLGASRKDVQRARLRVLEAMLFAGDTRGAREMIDQFFGQPDLTPREMMSLERLHCWILIHEGRPEVARDRLEALVFDANRRLILAFAPALVDLARIRGRLQEWPQAEEALQQHFDDASKLRRSAADIEAWTIAGFVRRRLGQEERAFEAWSQAYEIAVTTGRLDLMDATMAGSLSGRLKVDDVPRIIELLPQIEGSKLGDEVRRRVADDAFVATLLRNMWRSRRGLETAERIKFFGCTYAEAAYLQGLAGVHEVFRQAIVGASTPDEPYSLPLANEMPDEIEEMMWGATGRLSDSFRARTLGEYDFLRLFQTHYRGVTNALLGWNGVRPNLAPRTRGPVAYAMACRLAQLGQRDDARELLETATADAESIGPEHPQERDVLLRAIVAKQNELQTP